MTEPAPTDDPDAWAVPRTLDDNGNELHPPLAAPTDVAALVALRKPGRHLSAYDEGWNDALDIAEQRVAADLAQMTQYRDNALSKVMRYEQERWDAPDEIRELRADLAAARASYADAADYHAKVEAERDALRRQVAAVRALADADLLVGPHELRAALDIEETS